ncbi:hypothetical protein Scep_001907 [Stephania cephalantha]|uniref:Uncharacterized protein n=1 Tax=Stephania cephalantha TaxID=152367 RepID=A0AAP0L960_9MAGN
MGLTSWHIGLTLWEDEGTMREMKKPRQAIRRKKNEVKIIKVLTAPWKVRDSAKEVCIGCRIY